MDLPSGDQARESMLPVRWVSCLIPPVDLVQRKICSCSAFSDFGVQVEVKASAVPSGDQTGASLAQSALDGARILSIFGSATSGRRLR